MLTYVYIAGPYRGKATHGELLANVGARSYFEIEANINLARKAGATLAQLNIPFFCPHTNFSHSEVITPGVNIEWLLESDMIFLDLASALWILEGWEESEGTLGELERATKNEQPVFYSPYELTELAAFWKGAA